MSRRKQSNPQHLGELPLTPFENGQPASAAVDANAHQVTTEGADELNGDVHVCGKCRGEFIIISEFLEHKQNCCKDLPVVIVNEGGGPHQDSETPMDNHSPNQGEVETEGREGGERVVDEVNDEIEEEIKNLRESEDEDTKDNSDEFGLEQNYNPAEEPKSIAGDSRHEPMDFNSNPPLKPESSRSPIENGRSPIENIRSSFMNGLSGLPLPPSNFALHNMEHTKYAVSQICNSLSPSVSPPTREDMTMIQDQLYALQQQHLQQLNVIQHIQNQVNTYTSQQPKPLHEPPKSTSPTSSTSSSPTLPTISLPLSVGPPQEPPREAPPAPPPPPPPTSSHLSPRSSHLMSPPTSASSMLPSFDSIPLPPQSRLGPLPGMLSPGGFPMLSHRPPFELLQQAAIPPISSPLHSVPPSPFGKSSGPGGLLGLHRSGKPPNVSMFDAKFAADDPFFRHKCRFCHKVFGSDSALQIHIRSHTGERPFKCNICGNRFSTKGNLKVHFQRHQARYPHIQMDTIPHPPSPPPQERPPPIMPSSSSSSVHPPSIHQVPMPTIPNDVAKLPMETTNASHQAVQPASGSPNASNDSGEFQIKTTTNEWRPPMASPTGSLPDERPPRPSSVPPRPASEPARSPMEPRPVPDNPRPASSSDISEPRYNLSSGMLDEPQSMPPKSSADFMSPMNGLNGFMQSMEYQDHKPPKNSAEYYGEKFGESTYNTPSSLKLLAEQGFRPSETSKLQELVENIEQKITDPNQCVICHRVLSCKSALQMHYRIHTGERPFRCRICSRSFTTKGNLKTHYGVHRMQSPIRATHDCPICQKRFTNEIVLQQHLRLHAAEGIPLPNSMHFMMRPQMGNYGPEIALQRPMPMMMNGMHPLQHERERFERDHERSERDRLDDERLERSHHDSGRSERAHHDSERSELHNGERSARDRHDSERSTRDRHDSERSARDHHDSERSQQALMERERSDHESERLEQIHLERERLERVHLERERSEHAHLDRERFERAQRSNERSERDHLDTERSEEAGEHLTNGLGPLSNGPNGLGPLSNGPNDLGPLSNGPHLNDQTSENPLSDENNLAHKNDKELRDRDDDALENEVADEGLTEKQIEEAMFTPSEPSQGDAASPQASFTDEGHQPSEMQHFLNHHERQSIDLQHHRFDHQRSLDNITNALKMKMASMPLNNNTEMRGHNGGEQYSEPQSPFSKSEANSMTSERPSEVPSIGEDHPNYPLHIDESSSRLDNNGVLDLTARCSGETSPSMPQSQGLPTSTAAMFAGLGAPSLLLGQGPGGLIYPPGRRPISNNTTCRFCGKVFACTSALQIHYRSHTKERPFKCEICVKGFSTRGNLKQHMLTHKIRELPSQLFDPTRVRMPMVPVPPYMPEKPDISRFENARPEHARPENMRPENLRHENMRPENIRPENMRPENMRSENMRSENARPENPRLENPRPENPRPENPRLENPRPENPRPENPRPENPRSENPRSENPRPENPRLENPRPENPSPENPSSENPRSENPRPENPRPENLSPENPRPENPLLDNQRQENSRPEDARREIARADDTRSVHSQPETIRQDNAHLDNMPYRHEIPRYEHSRSESELDLQRIHPSLKRPLPPDMCENEPLMKRTLTLKHQCRVCDKQFQSDSALQIHMRTHTGEKPFKCHICGRAFTTKGNMKVHMGTHMWNGGTRRGRRIAFDPPLLISPKEGEVFRKDFLGVRPPFEGGFFQYPSPLNGFTALSKANEISVIQNHQTGPGHQQARLPESPNSVIMKADGPNPELRELRELREMQENKIREMHESSMRELHENSIREMHEKSFREMHESKIRELHESKIRELHESKIRELHENKMREMHENKIREMHESSIREIRGNTLRDLRESAMREMRENALREMRESTMREMQKNAMRDLKPEPGPERLTTA